MKRNLIFSLLLVLAVSSVSYAIPVSHEDNPHNMSSGSAIGSVRALSAGTGGTDQICVFCHTPHSAAAKSPLWNRPDPDGPVGGFQLYAQPLVIKANPGVSRYELGAQYPNGASRMCLSCHDGTTSIGVLLANETILMEGGLTTLSTSINLSTSHPISFTYDANVIALPLLVGYQLPDPIVDTPLDASGQMQCTTCHDPHEDSQALTGLPFWRNVTGPSYYDDVCSNCHTGATNASPPPIHNIPPP